MSLQIELNEKKNVIVIGGSYSGAHAAQMLAKQLPDTHRVILIEKNSHFHHLYVLPRFHLLSGHERKAFIPYSFLFNQSPIGSGVVLQAVATKITKEFVQVNTELEKDIQIPYEYLVYALGARIPIPMNGLSPSLTLSLSWLQSNQQNLEKHSHITIIGGGALGIQFAGDIKELFPHKKVTLIHSRTRFLPLYLPEMHELIKKKLEELGVEIVFGKKIQISSESFPPLSSSSSPFQIFTLDGYSFTTDCAILCTGQQFNSELIAELDPTLISNPSKEIRVKGTLQLDSPEWKKIFAIGDVAKTGAMKTGNAGWFQAETASKNILNLLSSSSLETYKAGVPMIKITVGLKYQVSQLIGPDGIPYVKDDYDGELDLHAGKMWPLFGASSSAMDPASI